MKEAKVFPPLVSVQLQRASETLRELTHQIKEARGIIESGAEPGPGLNLCEKSPKELDRERGKALRVVRMSFGVTLGTLANYLGLSVASLSTLERGEHPVSEGRVRMYIDAILKVSK